MNSMSPASSVLSIIEARVSALADEVRELRVAKENLEAENKDLRQKLFEAERRLDLLREGQEAYMDARERSEERSERLSKVRDQLMALLKLVRGLKASIR